VLVLTTYTGDNELTLLNRPPSGLFLNLPRSSSHWIFGLVNIATGQLPHPLVNDEPMPPHEQHLVLVIDHYRRGCSAHAHDVLLDSVPSGSPTEAMLSRINGFSSIKRSP
jgi:hypothetical protein